MNETTFENARIGDRVWSMVNGWGEIQYIDTEGLRVGFDCHTHVYYAFDGRHLASLITEKIQTLFWGEIKFEAPPRPKRKTKKVIEGWVNVNGYEIIDRHIYRNKEDAMQSRLKYIPLDPIFLHHEYEREE